MRLVLRDVGAEHKVGRDEHDEEAEGEEAGADLDEDVEFVVWRRRVADLAERDPRRLFLVDGGAHDGCFAGEHLVHELAGRLGCRHLRALRGSLLLHSLELVLEAHPVEFSGARDLDVALVDADASRRGRLAHGLDLRVLLVVLLDELLVLLRDLALAHLLAALRALGRALASGAHDEGRPIVRRGYPRGLTERGGAAEAEDAHADGRSDREHLFRVGRVRCPCTDARARVTGGARERYRCPQQREASKIWIIIDASDFLCNFTHQLVGIICLHNDATTEPYIMPPLIFWRRLSRIRYFALPRRLDQAKGRRRIRRRASLAEDTRSPQRFLGTSPALTEANRLHRSSKRASIDPR